MFDQYMDQGKTYEAWQLAHAMIQAVNMNTKLAWATNDLVKNVRCVWSLLSLLVVVISSSKYLCFVCELHPLA